MKNIIKKVSIVAVVLVLFLVNMGTSYGSELEKNNFILQDNMGLRYSEAYIVDVGLDSYGLDLEANLFIKAKQYDGSITGTLSLQKYSYGNWYTVKSWSFDENGKVSLYKEYQGSKNKAYRLKLNANVNGEHISKTSRIKKLR